MTQSKSKRTKLLVLDLAVFCVVAGSWLLFTAHVSPHELALGFGSAVLATWIDSLAWRRMRVRFLATLHEVLSVWRLPWYVVSGCWEMFVILARELAGKKAGSFFRATPFHRTSGIEGISQTILATGYTTVAPNFIVIGVYREHLLFHQLEKSSVPKMIRELETKG